MSSNVRTLVECRDVLGEGPVWHADEQALYWIDVDRALLQRCELSTGRHEQWKLPRRIGSFVRRARGGFLLAFRSGLAFLDRPGEEPRPIELPGLSLAEERLNDGKCDRRGRFWVTTMDREVKRPIGRLCCIDGELTVRATDTGAIVGNGPSWSPDSRTLYFDDSRARAVYAYDYDPDCGVASGKRVFASFETLNGRPDGCTVDAEGGLWVAEIHGWRVVRLLPDGRFDRAIEVPCERPTSVCFGGPNYETLFVTSSTMTLSEEALRRQPLAGALFAVEPGVRGLPEAPFAG